MPNTVWQCGDYTLSLGAKTYVMGVVNTTPDSFSGDGVLGVSAIERALKMVGGGADILDVGGESTRPGAVLVSAEEEKRRVLPLLQSLVKKVNVPISIDTTKAEVARAVLDAGASIINDISAGTFDDAMPGVLSKSKCGVVLMHLRGTPQTMGWSAKTEDQRSKTKDVIEEVLAFWQERVAAAREAGIEETRVCLDPGFGFGKSLEENLELLRRGRELKDFGFALMAATSRKSTIGKVLGTPGQGDLPVEMRLFGTAATVAVAIQNGADVVRVHDVQEMVQVARMTDAIVRS